MWWSRLVLAMVLAASVAVTQVQPASAATYQCDPYGNCWVVYTRSCTPWWQFWSAQSPRFC
jgi:hypothetical protein